ncbi:MAG: DUF3095 domain-containing protein [Roseibium sp.]|uniref:DUF3095 family protein n=1 Tax=Roseibium sp. TaxID=1936156 RepID=UPI002606124A|nr:DUF3095 family protein [Roseibium sp.]MCV0427722.1 DUF3095 domain-containing protein [Roseibium sp.]
MSAEDFYSELPSFTDFSSVGALDDYRPVPDDWFVLAADIVRSGDAVAEGRYKDVNMIGAAVIAAVLNSVGRERIPFVFGGDGAMLVVPAKDLELACDALAGVVDLARQVMELELRAAAIPVADLRQMGGDVKLRKYQLSPGNHLAMILGDGLAIADRILKDPDANAPYAIRREQAELPPLEGLSCRWEPLPAQNGQIVSLIIKPCGNRTLPQFMEGFAKELGFNPLTDDNRTKLAEGERLCFKFPPRGLSLEVQLTSARNHLRGWAKSLIECVAFVYGYATGWRVGPFDPKRYFKELGLNTDHRKIGDSLQLVLDLTLDQLNAVENYLTSAFAEGEVIFGMHVSSEALMTCFVEDIGKSQHIHFVDGSNGGLSLAAAEFKKRREALEDSLKAPGRPSAIG